MDLIGLLVWWFLPFHKKMFFTNYGIFILLLFPDDISIYPPIIFLQIRELLLDFHSKLTQKFNYLLYLYNTLINIIHLIS